MKKKWIISIFTVLFALIFNTCDNNSDNATHKITTKRYETVPYSSNSVNTSPVYSIHDGTNNYYLFLLGHINYVPIVYREAVIYNGQTPVTIGYSYSDITKTTIKQSVQTAYEYSVTNTSTSWSVTPEIGIKIAWFEAKIAGSFGESTRDETKTRSVANTYETTLSKSNNSTDSIEATIGNNDEPEGKYRYSFFSTTDVYYILVTNREKTKVDDAYIAVCARPQASWAWGIDYDPDVGGNFGKTAKGDLLEIPSIVLSQLPDPTNEYNETTLEDTGGGGSNSPCPGHGGESGIQGGLEL